MSVVTAGLGIRSGELTLRGLGVVRRAANDGAATADLLPWDFLREFEVQKRVWLQQRTRKEIIESVKELVEKLPESATETMPKTRTVERLEGVDTIVMRLDYAALLMNFQALDHLIGILLEEDDILALLLMEP